jgi:hypothetical protein
MIFGFAILLVALLLSGVAAYYSVAGLVAVFSAATVPVIIMGGSLELGKIAATVWLHNNWRRAGWAFKFYLIPAVLFLMVLTSMGIFGYLSKAHSDQSIVSGDALAKVAIYDEKIKTERENIETNRRTLRQLDEAVDQLVGRSRDERGVERSVQIRRNQQAERTRIARDIEAGQKRIAQLNEERAPLAAAVRQVEAEVGPIKYIAALVYDENPDTNTLERAVRLMIIMIVLVFDPLAVTLILAANKQFQWARQNRNRPTHSEPTTMAAVEPVPEPVQAAEPAHVPEPVNHRVDQHTHPYLFKGNFHAKPPGWVSVGPMPAVPPTLVEPQDFADDDQEIASESNPVIKQAIKQWKAANPHSTLKEQRRIWYKGEIDELPWLLSIPISSTFGTEFPKAIRRGDTHVSIKTVPHAVYKWNGRTWMEIDKQSNDSYLHNAAYISYLINEIESGRYDPDLLSDNEREQVAAQLSGKQ